MSGSSFKDWLENQKAAQNAEEELHQDDPSFFAQFSAIQDNVTTQLQGLSGSLPEAGPLSSAFRQRVTRAVYLLIASAIFAIFAVVIGLPTLVLRPTKFVLCMTLSTLFAASSVIVMQTPSVFLSSLSSGGLEKAAPVVLLGCSMLFTLYVSIFVHRYLQVLVAGGVQLTCLFFYLASFIPGGKKGLTILLRTTYVIVKTALYPLIFVAKKTIILCLSRIFS